MGRPVAFWLLRVVTSYGLKALRRIVRRTGPSPRFWIVWLISCTRRWSPASVEGSGAPSRR